MCMGCVGASRLPCAGHMPCVHLHSRSDHLTERKRSVHCLTEGERCFANLTSCEQRHLQLHMISSCKPHRLHLRDSLTSVSSYTRTSAIVLQT